QIFGNEMREAACRLVTFLTNHGTMPQQRQKAMVMFDCLVRRPVRVHTYSEQVHELITITRGVVVSLDDTHSVVGRKVIQCPGNEIGWDNFIAVQDDEKVVISLAQVIVQVACLEADMILAPHDPYPMLRRKGVDVTLVCWIGGII